MSAETEPPDDWDRVTGQSLSLEQWLNKLFSERAAEDEFFIDYEFPTDNHADEYFATIALRTERQVIDLLRHFLFPAGCFPQSDAIQLSFLRSQAKNPLPLPPDCKIRVPPIEELLERESTRRLLASVASKGQEPSWDGIRWVLDLLPHSPRSAIEAVDAYLLAHAQLLPDGRLRGLSHAVALIRAKFIQEIPNDARSTLFSLSPREFEHLVERLFAHLGYETQLTKSTHDDGRDVVAIRSTPAMREKVLIECKRYDKTELGPAEARALLGVVSNEPACRGVIVTTGHVTEGVYKYAPRIEVIDLQQLIRLLNEHFGNKWPSHVDDIIRESRLRYFPFLSERQ